METGGVYAAPDSERGRRFNEPGWPCRPIGVSPGGSPVSGSARGVVAPCGPACLLGPHALRAADTTAEVARLAACPPRPPTHPRAAKRSISHVTSIAVDVLFVGCHKFLQRRTQGRNARQLTTGEHTKRTGHAEVEPPDHRRHHHHHHPRARAHACMARRAFAECSALWTSSATNCS